MNRLQYIRQLLHVYPIRVSIRENLKPYDFANMLMSVLMKPSENEKNTYLNIFKFLLDYDSLLEHTKTCNPKLYLIGHGAEKLCQHLNCNVSLRYNTSDVYHMKLFLYCDCSHDEGVLPGPGSIEHSYRGFERFDNYLWVNLNEMYVGRIHTYISRSNINLDPGIEYTDQGHIKEIFHESVMNIGDETYMDYSSSLIHHRKYITLDDNHEVIMPYITDFNPNEVKYASECFHMMDIKQHSRANSEIINVGTVCTFNTESLVFTGFKFLYK